MVMILDDLQKSSRFLWRLTWIYLPVLTVALAMVITVAILLQVGVIDG